MTHTLQYLMKRRMHSAFVGRQEQLAFFRRNLQYKVEDDRRCFVINVSGQGGVGKTWLLRRFEDSAHKFNAVTAWTDEREDDVPGVMGDIAEQFETQGYPLTAFADRYRLYRQGWREIETDPEILSVFSTRLGRGVVKAGLDLARRVLGLTDPDTELVPQEPLVEKGGRFVAFVVRKLKDKDLAHLVLQPVEILTPLFLAGLREVAEKHPLAFFFDAYERTESFLDPWLRALLEGQYGDVPANIFLFVAGRHELDRNDWAPYEGLLARLRLDPFTEEEARAYLGRQGVDDERVVEAILALSGRLPLLVVTLAAESPDDPARVGDPSGTAVERFLWWVADDRQRQVALDAALPRRFDRDVVAVLAGEEEAGALFAWLKGRPFVEERREAGWVYHEVVRAQMLRCKRRESPRGWAGLHGRLVEYYEGLRDGLGLDEKAGRRDEDWQGYALEGLYHRLCRSPRGEVAAALNGFVAAWEAHVVFAWRWAGVVGQAGEDAGSEVVAGWGRRLREGVESLAGDRYGEAARMFSALLEGSGLEARWRAAVLGRRGETYRLTGRYEEALADFDRAIELDPDYAWAIANRGEAYEALGRYEEALADFDRAMEFDPDLDWAIASRGQVYEALGRYEEALADFERAIEIDPDYDWAIASRGRTYRLMGRNEEALADFERAMELDPDYASYIAGRGETYRLMGRYEEALADLDRAIALKPDYDWAIDSRGRTYRQMGRYEESLADFDRAIELKADYAWAIAGRGETYRQMGCYEEALADLDRAIALKPDYDWAIAYRGRTYRQMGRYEEALADFERAIALDPDYAWAIASRGETYWQTGRYEEALADFERAMELEPDDALHIASRGVTYRLMGRYEEALADFERAMELDPDDASYIADRGETYHLMERYEEALADFDRALEVEPNNAWYLYDRALTRQALGQADCAQADLVAAVRRARGVYKESPQDWKNVFNLALYYLAAGEAEEADRLYREALAGGAASFLVHMAIRDLDDFLVLFPEHAHARAVRRLLRAHLQEVEL